MPKSVQWLVKLFLIYLAIFTAFRIATVLFFKPEDITYNSLLPAFWLGLKYDLRWISFILFPIAFVSMFKKLNPFYSRSTRIFWTAYLGIITLFVLFFYGADFAQFSSARHRLDAQAMLPFKEHRNRFVLIWRSYPVIWISFALVGSVLMVLWMFTRQHLGIVDKNANVHKFTFRRRWHAVALLVLGFFMYGFFTARPLNIYRAFTLNNTFKSNLALNPLQNFFTTLRIMRQTEELKRENENGG